MQSIHKYIQRSDYVDYAYEELNSLVDYMPVNYPVMFKKNISEISRVVIRTEFPETWMWKDLFVDRFVLIYFYYQDLLPCMNYILLSFT